MDHFKTTGAPRVAATGALRDGNDDKGRYDLLPTRALRELAIHFQRGALAKGERNWEKGMPLSWFLDSGLRHGFSELEGQTDEDHARAACWNLICYLETRARIRAGLLPAELDDLPKLKPLPDAGNTVLTGNTNVSLVGGVLGVSEQTP